MEKLNSEEVVSNVIQKIIFYRKQHNFSHEKMADKLKISQSAYHKLESQNSKLSFERLIKIQHILNVPITELLDIKADNVYNQDIKDNGVGYQQIENLYQDNRELTEGYINTLKEEIVFLKDIIEKK